MTNTVRMNYSVLASGDEPLFLSYFSPPLFYPHCFLFLYVQVCSISRAVRFELNALSTSYSGFRRVWMSDESACRKSPLMFLKSLAHTL